MNGKITNYSIETQHDWCLISLVGKLDQADRIDIFQNSFRIERDLGRLIWAGRRRAFDVELTFEDLSIAIETKVHSDERGRWSESWQTKSIAEQRRNLKGLSFYITYGDSEFYTKPYETGPASPDFHHVTLERMISLVQSSLTAIPQIKESTDSVEWLRLMMIEREKREKAQELLHSFSEFRIRYLKIYEVNDFPRGRVAFSAPDLAFPVFSKLAKHWDESEYVARFGRLSIYPVPRGYSPVVDSILNFWEMWNGEKGPVLARDVVGNERRLYLRRNSPVRSSRSHQKQPVPAQLVVIVEILVAHTAPGPAAGNASTESIRGPSKSGWVSRKRTPPPCRPCPEMKTLIST